MLFVGKTRRRGASKVPGLAAAAAFALLGVAGTSAIAGENDRPVVVELFQSQGCSSCPPANANVIALSDRPDVLTLSFEVTYWDNLGWRDTFGSPAFTQRQWDYAHAFGRREVATPEVVVNGRADAVGDRRDAIEALIKKFSPDKGGPEIRVAGDKVVVGQGAPAHAEVLLVRYDPRTILVPIRAGENGGVTLPHKNVVKAVIRLGTWSGRPESFSLPSKDQAGLKTAILVQAGPGGPILTAARIA